MRVSSRPAIPSRLSLAALAAVSLLLIGLVACGPGSPEERVTQVRGQYSVELNTWFPKVEEPVIEEPAEGELAEGEAAEGEEAPAEEAEEPAEETEAAAEGEEAEGEAAEGEEAPAEPEGPSTTTIFFDLIVVFTGDEPLPGITVDVTQADASGTEKKAWREFLEMPDIVKGEAKQISFEEELEFTDGDQFSVQLLKYVDPANYGDYKEYAEAQ